MLIRAVGPLVLVVIAGIASACAPILAPSPTMLPIVDVLDYIIGADSLWPRLGDQYQAQIVDRSKREVCWVKYGDASMFECWTWDEDWIYHRVDHAVDGNTGESYSFTDGRWLPRYINPRVDWSLDVPANDLRWFLRSCQFSERWSHAFPYRVRAWFEPDAMVGELGPRSVLVLEYTPYDPISHVAHAEQFYFAKGAGWFRWASERGQVRFDRLGGPVIRGRLPDCSERQ